MAHAVDDPGAAPGEQRSALAAIGTLPGGRAVFAVALLHSIVEFSAWIIVAVVAYDRGGSAAAGIAAAAQLVPAALATPLITSAGDRFPRQRVLATAMTLLAVNAGVLAFVLAAEAPLVVVYAVAAVFTSVLSASPATLASLMVHHARTPTQLTICNAALSSVRAAGSLIGPGLVAVSLATIGPAWAFVAIGAVCGTGVVLVVHGVPDDDRVTTPMRVSDVLGETRAGLGHVVGERRLRRTLGFLGGTRMMIAAIEVTILVVAYDLVRGDGSTAATLTGCVAAGGVLAAVAVSMYTARHSTGGRLAQTALVGAVLMALPLLVLLGTSRYAVVIAAMFVVGVGEVFTAVAGQTVLQRVADAEMTSRVFGIQDSVSYASEAAGALLAGALFAAVSPSAGLAIVSATGLTLMVLTGLTLAGTERSTQVADPELVDTLRIVPFFAPLPLPTLERLAGFLEQRHVDPHMDVVTEGDIGREFYVLLDGRIEVEIAGQHVRTGGPPDFFGEIALLRDIPRTATVRAGAEGAVVGVVQREQFLAAVVGSISSRHAAEAVVSRRLPD